MLAYAHSHNCCLRNTINFLAGNQFFKLIVLNLSQQPNGTILIKSQSRRCIWYPIQLNVVAKGVMEKGKKNKNK